MEGLRTYLNDYQRRGVDFSVKDATVHNPFINMGEVVANLGVAHRLAFLPKVDVGVVGPQSYCALANSSCAMNPTNINFPIFPIAGALCDKTGECYN